MIPKCIRALTWMSPMRMRHNCAAYASGCINKNIIHGGGGGTRTLTPKKRGLNPPRLPVSPHRHHDSMNVHGIIIVRMQSLLPSPMHFRGSHRIRISSSLRFSCDIADSFPSRIHPFCIWPPRLSKLAFCLPSSQGS